MRTALTYTYAQWCARLSNWVSDSILWLYASELLVWYCAGLTEREAMRELRVLRGNERAAR